MIGVLNAMRDVIQIDVGGRGLKRDPNRNLVNACPHDFGAACRSFQRVANPTVAVVTGFLIPTANPPRGETDGPLGALFLARALTPLGIPVALATDPFCIPSLRVGLEACGLTEVVKLVELPPWPD